MTSELCAAIEGVLHFCYPSGRSLNADQSGLSKIARLVNDAHAGLVETIQLQREGREDYLRAHARQAEEIAALRGALESVEEDLTILSQSAIGSGAISWVHKSLRRISDTLINAALPPTPTPSERTEAERWVIEAARAIIWDSDDEEGLHYCDKAEAHCLMAALAALDAAGGAR